MAWLIAGLVVFLGAHSVRIVADGWRSRRIAAMGEGPWKGLFSVVSLAGFVLIVWGYGQTRIDPVELWQPPRWTAHATALLTLLAFVLIAAANVPGNHFKQVLGHPMVAGVKLWAFAHLLSNGRSGDVVLFGAILVWAIVDFASARRRDRAAGRRYPEGRAGKDVAAVVAGVAVWAVFAFLLHGPLIGVRPFG